LRRTLRGFAAAASVVAFTACGGWETPPPAPTAEAEPRWEDAFEARPKLLAVVYPTALRSDPVYGPLLRRAIELVREQSPVVAETRALDAMEDAEEVVIGVRPDTQERAGEIVVAVRGVRADIDPATLVDGEGRPLWGPGPTGRVRELVRTEGPEAPVPASLFELPGRTWVIASGDARPRARSAFVRPTGRPPLELEPNSEALVTLRIDGPSLVARIRPLQSSGALGTVGRGLEAVTLELGAGSATPDAGPDREIRASLRYANEAVAAAAEGTVREILAAIARKRPDDLAWLASARVDRPRSSDPHPPSGGAGGGGAGRDAARVVLTAPLPSRLVGALLHAGAATLTGESAPSPQP
jgi:hypothetical protein